MQCVILSINDVIYVRIRFWANSFSSLATSTKWSDVPLVFF